MFAVKGRRIAAENARWRVYLDHVRDERGNEVTDYLVVAGRNVRKDGLGGVTVLPIVGDQVALVQIYRHAIGRTLWEAPRGFIDQDETPAEAAQRELNEETGLTCPTDSLIPLGTFAHEPGTIAARGALFAALRCSGTLRSADDELGLSSVRLFAHDEVANLIARSEIEEAGTLIAHHRFCARYRLPA